MDQDKLAKLRARYADAAGSRIYDPDFAAVAATQFKGVDQRKWPFMDPATFLSAPFRPDAVPGGFAGLDVALIGVPMDLGVTNRAGARLGPRAVRAIERIGPYNHVLASRRVPSARSPTSATCRSAAASGWTIAMTTSSAFYADRRRPACCRSRSAATIRSPTRS